MAGVALHDLNGDGRMDVVAAVTTLDGVLVLFGKGDGTCGTETLIGGVAVRSRCRSWTSTATKPST